MNTKDKILNELHKELGKCGCCGKKECPGKEVNSQLPGKLNTEIVLKILDKFLEKE